MIVNHTQKIKQCMEVIEEGKIIRFIEVLIVLTGQNFSKQIQF
jgi:hypothetical protein